MYNTLHILYILLFKAFVLNQCFAITCSLLVKVLTTIVYMFQFAGGEMLLAAVSARTWTRQLRVDVPLSLYGSLRVIQQQLWRCRYHGIDIYSPDLQQLRPLHCSDMVYVYDVASVGGEHVVVAARLGLYLMTTRGAYDMYLLLS